MNAFFLFSNQNLLFFSLVSIEYDSNFAEHLFFISSWSKNILQAIPYSKKFRKSFTDFSKTDQLMDCNLNCSFISGSVVINFLFNFNKDCKGILLHGKYTKTFQNKCFIPINWEWFLFIVLLIIKTHRDLEVDFFSFSK